MNRSPLRIVLTGGPGSGKTTLLEALAGQGHATAPEAGRAVILQQQASGGDALPWRNPARFADAMLTHAVAAFDAADDAPGPVFFARGIGAVLGYLELVGLAHDAAAQRCRAAAQGRRYHSRVFIAPFWPEIYVNDAERKQDLAEAEATCAAMARVWPALGYDLVWLPQAPVAERVAFIMANLTGR